MQDPEIQTILTDPVMRQVGLVLGLCYQHIHNSGLGSTTLVCVLYAIKNLIHAFAFFFCRY